MTAKSGLLISVALLAVSARAVSAPETAQEAVVLPRAIDTCEWGRQVVARETGSQDHGVPGYVTFGPVCVGALGSRINEVKADAREFLWSHWRAHQRALAMLTTHCKEGDPSTSLYYVEPAATGEWQVRVVIEHLRVDRRRPLSSSGSVQAFRVRTSYVAPVLRRIEPPHDGLSARVFIDDTAIRASRSYILSLQIDEGPEVVEF